MSAEPEVDFRAVLATFQPQLQRGVKQAAQRNGWSEDDKRLHVEIIRDTLVTTPRITNGYLFTPATVEQLIAVYSLPTEQAA